jgi:hypothetical protein
VLARGAGRVPGVRGLTHDARPWSRGDRGGRGCVGAWVRRAQAGACGVLGWYRHGRALATGRAAQRD